MNMNKIAFNILTVPVLAVLAVSCGGQDEIYKEWVKKGGYDYPAKAINLSSVIGYQNVIVNWEKPMDPAVRTATLFWDNYAKSIDVDYADYPDGKVSIEVGELEDRSYTFDIVNYDDVPCRRDYGLSVRRWLDGLPLRANCHFRKDGRQGRKNRDVQGHR